ncbi:MAG TPA: flagellar hook-basal body complex protein FliE [Rhodoblastus sp.]|nr:flagellar hook-basal body complex protein FliE [Rhodoblastus sp.]
MIPALLPVAASAVQAAAAAPAAAVSAATSGADFGAALAKAAGSAVQNLRAAETTATAAIEGKATIQQVVDGVMTAERTLQTTLAIRDKAVAAYQQVSQMQI